jgi:hypothetical protein
MNFIYSVEEKLTEINGKLEKLSQNSHYGISESSAFIISTL